ncbi:MAG: glucose-6-phosphate isomerase [Endozoicomonadaceae bacterium]|nr:glucose-6-phosphate isomerase [Endozoicomonadaceae bacterium]
MLFSDNSTPLNQYTISNALVKDKARMQTTTLEKLFAASSDRFTRYSIEAADLFLDYSKNLIDETTLNHLLHLAEQASLPEAIKAMFSGEKINTTEQRAVLHTALRNFDNKPVLVDGKDVMPAICQVREKMQEFTDKIHNETWKGWTGKSIRHIVNIGIGGSYLGIKTVIDALKPYHRNNLQAHFIVNIDPGDIAHVCKALDPERTLFIIASKSFGTLETLENALSAKEWMQQQGMPEAATAQHFVAVSSNIKKAVAFGIAEENIFPLWDWVGGRYSLWSTIGLLIPLLAGFDNFIDLLKGAHAMDKHFQTSAMNANMPVILGLLGVWYHNYFGAESYAVLPYDSGLETFTNHLQQVDMESNGKTVKVNGESVTYHTGAVIWGNTGTNGQHAYHQLLHQGSRFIPIDFIVPLTSHYHFSEQHTHLVANAFAQSQALMSGESPQRIKESLRAQGKDEATIQTLIPHKKTPGNRPSNTITMQQLNPATMGALLALYEHKVFVQGILWQINSFDQWGVELGKLLGNKIFTQLAKHHVNNDEDTSTKGLIDRFLHANNLQ